MVTYPDMQRPTVPMRITDLSDPRIAMYQQMSDGRLMAQAGLFVAEGRLVVERLLQEARYRVESVLLSPAAFRALAPALDSAGRDIDVFEIPANAFERTTGYHIHRGCLALVQRPPQPNWQSVVHGADTLLVLEAVADADNVGSLFRSARALGADGILLSPACCDPLYRKAIRTSMGAVLRMPWAIVEPWPGSLAALRDEGLVLAALTPSADAVELGPFVMSTRDVPVAWLLGTEGAGLSADALAAADARVRIPMTEGVDSLNVAVAAAVALSRRLEIRDQALRR